MSYRVAVERRGEREIYRLFDDASGASAAVLPSYGFNLFDLRLPAAGRVWPVVVSAEGWEEHPDKPARHGFPVLFPFPNRIRDAAYSFEGKDYTLAPTKPPHAIHGFALEADWEVTDHAAGPDGATLAARFQISKQAPAALTSWPADALLEMRYTLAGRKLTLDIVASNPSDRPLPYGLGFHPYFRLPIDPASDPSKARLVLPAAEEWVIEGGLPTGDRRPVDRRLDFRDGRPIVGLALDDVLTGLAYEGGIATCRMIDGALGAELRLTFDRGFREIVVFTPPAFPGVIAVEPYTQTTDAIHLAARGVDGGLRVLPPGGSDTMMVALETVG